MKELSEKIQDDILTFLNQYDPPFVFTEEDKETMEDELCNIVVFHIQEAKNG